MKRSETIKQVEVQQAWLEGHDIEAKLRSSFGGWDLVINKEHQWDFKDYEYRIAKPKPLEIDLYINQHGTFSLPVPLEINGSIWVKKKFREVLDE